jgi:CheY-like chemotaxis protein
MNVKKIDTLCLVDDDDIFQFLTSEIIRTTDLVNQIKIFSNGSEAIDFLKKVKDYPAKLPDIIFLDLFMPIMDGWGFLNEFILLRPNLKKKITIYIVSSSIDPADLQRAKSFSDVTDFIIKPITEKKIINTIKELA